MRGGLEARQLLQVMGKALFAGAGLFEMAAAVGRALASAAAPILTVASISAPCAIGVSGQPQLLLSTVDLRWACFITCPVHQPIACIRGCEFDMATAGEEVWRWGAAKCT